MSKRLYKWKVDPAPTGPRKVFSKRAWPTAEYADGDTCAYITCEDNENYHPKAARTGEHGLLTVHVCDYSHANGNCPWTRKRLTAKFKTLEEAKQAFDDYVIKYPGILKTNNVTEVKQNGKRKKQQKEKQR